MKKLALFLGMVMACASLAACAPNGDNSGDPLDPSGGNLGNTENGGNTGDNGTTETDGNGPSVTFSAGIGAFADGKTSVVLGIDDNGRVSFDKADPRADGHAFLGWYNGAVEFDPNAKYTQSQTFTAKYRSGADAVVYEALFDEGSTVSIQMNMSDAEWKKLDNDYVVFSERAKQLGMEDRGKSPIYRVADSVTIGIDDGDGMLYYYYEEVGVRLKGNTSRHRFYGDEGFFDNVHFKLSFKQTFDDIEDGYTSAEVKPFSDRWAADKAAKKTRKARTLGGMEKIDIKYNSTLDDTYIRELFAMKLFRDNGIVAPHITLCSLSALEKDTKLRNLGVYRIHEPIDEAFIERNFNDTGVGDLWKCTWGVKGPADLTYYDLDSRIGVEDELNFEFYSYDKKTNKKKDADGNRDLSSMRNFIQAINNDNVDFSAILDTDYFAKFEAVNYMLGNPDCIRNHYNNYYMYFRKSDGKAVLIPYDYDRCLGSTQWNEYNAMTEVTPFTRLTTPYGSTQNNPLYKKLIVKDAPAGEGSVLMKYRSNLLALASSDLIKVDRFNALKDSYKARYGRFTNDAVKNSIAFDGGTNNMSYSNYINAKRRVIEQHKDDYNA